MQPCPLMLTQAMVDRGRFMYYKKCNPKIVMDAIDTTRELSSVFLMVNPRLVILNFSLVEPY